MAILWSEIHGIFISENENLNRISMRKKYLLYLIYLYAFLIFCDSIFRKWFFQSLSSFIMGIKILISIVIVFGGLRYIVNYATSWEKSFALVGTVVFFTTLLFGHGNIFVALYGCLPFWFGLTVSLVIGYVLSTKNVLDIGKCVVYLSIVNSVITIIQFTLPPSHFLNYRGGEVDERIANADIGSLAGAFRPAGIFMSTGFASLFVALAISLILYFLFIREGFVKKKVLYAAFVLCVVSSIASTSRSTIFWIVAVSIYFLYVINSKKVLYNLLKGVFILIPCLIIFLSTNYGNKAINNMGNRFENASHSVEATSTTNSQFVDLFNRGILYNIEAIINPHTIDGSSVPFFGFGQGMSTQVGGNILGISKNAGFALAEWDGLRIMCESGLLFGWIILFIREFYVWRFIPKMAVWRRKKRYLLLMILPSLFLSFYPSFTWGNLTNAHFAFFMAGVFLCIKRERYVI